MWLEPSIVCKKQIATLGARTGPNTSEDDAYYSARLSAATSRVVPAKPPYPSVSRSCHIIFLSSGADYLETVDAVRKNATTHLEISVPQTNPRAASLGLPYCAIHLAFVFLIRCIRTRGTHEEWTCGGYTHIGSLQSPAAEGLFGENKPRCECYNATSSKNTREGSLVPRDTSLLHSLFAVFVVRIRPALHRGQTQQNQTSKAHEQETHNNIPNTPPKTSLALRRSFAALADANDKSPLPLASGTADRLPLAAEGDGASS